MWVQQLPYKFPKHIICVLYEKCSFCLFLCLFCCSLFLIYISSVMFGTLVVCLHWFSLFNFIFHTFIFPHFFPQYFWYFYSDIVIYISYEILHFQKRKYIPLLHLFFIILAAHLAVSITEYWYQYIEDWKHDDCNWNLIKRFYF